MKILHLSNVIGEHKGGGIHEVVSNLYKYQRGKNIEPHIWYPGFEDDANSIRLDDNIKCLPTIGKPNFGFVKGLFHSVPKEIHKFDILHQHGIWMPISLYSLKIKRNSNLKSIIQPHGFLLPYSRNLAKRKKQVVFSLFEKKNLNSSNVLVACAEYEAKVLKELFPEKHVAIIPNGIPDEFFIAENTRNHTMEKKRRMLFLSQIIPVKGLERVLRSIKAIGVDEFLNWEFIIAGYEDVNYKSFLDELISNLGLKSIVKFVGPKFGLDKLNLIDNSDVFILPSYNENYGIVVAEALARGIPVLTTKGAPWDELVTNRCGFWVDNTELGIKEGLLQVMSSSREELQEMGARGRKLIKNNYLWSKTSLKTIEMYDWVLKGGQKPNFII